MTEHKRETAFLRRAILFDDSGQGRKIEEGIVRIQRDVRCLQRAAVLLTLPAVVAAAGFAYGVVLEENFPYGGHQFVIRVLSVAGLTSLISLTGLSGLWIIYRRRLNRLWEQCRQLVTNLLESRQQQSRMPPPETNAGDFGKEAGRHRALDPLGAVVSSDGTVTQRLPRSEAVTGRW